MLLAARLYAFAAFVCAVAIIGQWSAAIDADLWRAPAAALLLALIIEGIVNRRQGIRIQRRLPARGFLGQSFASELVVHNPATYALRLDTLDEPPPTLKADYEPLHWRIAPGESMTQGVSLIPQELGEMEWETLRTRSLGAFGLAWWHRRLRLPAKLPVVPWVTVRSKDLATDEVAVVNRVRDALAFPVFVKPANLGSSVGTSQVETTEALLPALREAARYDTKILVERAVDAREIEVAILGNDRLEASVPGEIVTGHDFYDYEAKYIDGDTELLIPAPLSEEQKRVARELALQAVQALEGEGLARVDFLLDRHSDEFFISEVNSIPGFTEGSMYPRLWDASGLAYPALLDRLIELAIERHRTRSGLETLFKGGAR